MSIPAAAGRVRTFAELAALIMFAALITAFVDGIPFLSGTPILHSRDTPVRRSFR
jgi:hypothetical protein